MTQTDLLMHIVTFTVLTFAFGFLSHRLDARVLMFVCAFIALSLAVWYVVCWQRDRG